MAKAIPASCYAAYLIQYDQAVGSLRYCKQRMYVGAGPPLIPGSDSVLQIAACFMLVSIASYME